MWKWESKIWQYVRSGLKNLQSVRIWIRTHIVSIFKYNSFQRGRYRHQKSSICQSSNQKIHKVSAAESKCFCARFLIKKSTTCQNWNQTVTRIYVIYWKECFITHKIFYIKNFTTCLMLMQKYTTRQYLNQMLYNVFCFISENVQKFWVYKEKFITMLHCESNFLQRVRSRIENLQRLRSILESKV